MLKRTFKCVLLAAMLSSIAPIAMAEEAPVYDADNFPPQFDGQSDAGAQPQGYGPPPPSAAMMAPPPESLSMEQRVSRAEHQISNLQGKDIPTKVESLQSEVQSLRGQVEQLTRQLQQVQTQQRTMYTDLDKRLVSSKQAAAKAAPAAPEEVAPQKTVTTTTTAANKPKPSVIAPADSDVADKGTAITAPVPAAAKTSDVAQQPNVAEEQQIYQTAYDLIKVKKYNEAITALQKMLQKYPTGQFAANAHYWLGELYGLLGKNDQSAVEFDAVVKNYPDSPKVADAQLKLGLINAAQFKWTDAKAAFKKVINHYPGTATARLAAEQLKQIREAGH